MFRVSIYALIPVQYLREIIAFHPLDSNVDQVLVVVREKTSRLLRLNPEALRQTEQDELQGRVSLIQVLRVAEIIKRSDALIDGSLDPLQIGASSYQVRREFRRLFSGRASYSSGRRQRIKKILLLPNANAK